MIVYGVISPHPPIILPEIGGQETEKVKKTILSLEKASRRMADLRPERVLIISPHEEHGFEVPLYYLAKKLSPKTELEKILVTNPSHKYYYDLGKEYAKKTAREKKRTAIIASGDLSHVLREDGPYGYNPAGEKLDKITTEAVRKKDPKKLLSIDPALLDEGAECGLRSIIFLMSAFEPLNHESKILSYEAPFGVGYLVATFEPKEIK